MGHLRFSSLLLGLMLSLVVALGVPSLVLANKLEATSTKNDQALGSVKVYMKPPSPRITYVAWQELDNEMEMLLVPQVEGFLMQGNVVGMGEKGESSLECVLMTDRGLMGNRGLASRFSLVGVTPFSSDYHAPKGHPPKHN